MNPDEEMKARVERRNKLIDLAFAGKNDEANKLFEILTGIHQINFSFFKK